MAFSFNSENFMYYTDWYVNPKYPKSFDISLPLTVECCLIHNHITSCQRTSLGYLGIPLNYGARLPRTFHTLQRPRQLSRPTVHIKQRAGALQFACTPEIQRVIPKCVHSCLNCHLGLGQYKYKKYIRHIFLILLHCLLLSASVDAVWDYRPKRTYQL